MTKFTFGDRSVRQLQTVHKKLENLCYHALSISNTDFGITEGVRTEERQKHLVSGGFSQLINSKHRAHEKDGLSRAIDFMPFYKGKYRDAWPFINPVANAFMQASKGTHTPIIWGGAWGMDLWSFRHIGEAQEAYILLRAEREGTPFFDGFHIELAGNIDEKVTFEA